MSSSTTNSTALSCAYSAVRGAWRRWSAPSRSPACGGVEDRVELDLGPVRDATITQLLDTLRALDGMRLVNYTFGAARLARVAEAVSAPSAVEEDDIDDDAEEDDALR